jgi:hypothetical protein
MLQGVYLPIEWTVLYLAALLPTLVLVWLIDINPFPDLERGVVAAFQESNESQRCSACRSSYRFFLNYSVAF